MLPRFRLLDPGSADDVACVQRWAHDPAIRHLHRPARDAEHARSVISIEATRAAIMRASDRGRETYLIELDDIPVGEVNVCLGARELVHDDRESAFIGLVVGEATYRRRGLGSAAMRFAEERTRERGGRRVELGVFSFNHPARALYGKLGYREFARIPGITWWRDKRWTDIRLEKLL